MDTAPSIIFSDCQFRFRRRRSTYDALGFVSDIIYGAIEEGEYAVAVGGYKQCF